MRVEVAPASLEAQIAFTNELIDGILAPCDLAQEEIQLVKQKLEEMNRRIDLDESPSFSPRNAANGG